jgi:transposase InsO family protein
MWDMAELGLKELTLQGIMAALGVSRSQTYEWAGKAKEWRAAQLGPGRPRRQNEQPKARAEDGSQHLGDLVRDWLMAHPGAVCPGPKRMVYSEVFRAYVLDLVGPGVAASALTREQAAHACGVSPNTLASWLAGGKRVAQVPPAVEPVVPPMTDPVAAPESVLPTSQWAAQAAQVLELWSKWHGPFGAFCASLKDHQILMSAHTVRNILAVSGKRRAKRRRGANPDPEAIRGELLRMFPNAQWNADGKSVLVKVGEQAFCFTMELVVDTATAAHLGFSLREHEDSQGLIGALDQATASAGEPPLGLLRDARKCNVSEAVETRLSEAGIISLVSTIGRPQNNSPAENSFSLMGHKLPVPVLPSPESLSPSELGRLVMAHLLLGVCIGRNHTPRLRQGGRTPVRSFAESKPTDEDKARAREELRRLRRQVEAQAQADRLRCQPMTLALVRQALLDLGLSDPKDQFAPAIAHYGLEAALEAISIFQAKKEAGTLPEMHHERYLLGITRNLAYRNEDTRTYEALLDLRAKAGDLVLAPLHAHDSDLAVRLPAKDYLPAVLDLALASPALIDRTYWRRRVLATLETLQPAARNDLGRHCARKVAARQSLRHKERDLFISELARVVMPLVA